MNLKKTFLLVLSTFFICSSFLLAPKNVENEKPKSKSNNKKCCKKCGCTKCVCKKSRCNTCGRKPKKQDSYELRNVESSSKTSQSSRRSPRKPGSNRPKMKRNKAGNNEKTAE